MTNEQVQPDGQKKRGRPKGVRPKCEKEIMVGYPEPEKYVVWGIQPACKRFKRKGIAVMYNPDHPGGQVRLLPVTDDGGDFRWRYEYIPGPNPYDYCKLDIEPGQAGGLPRILRELADSIEGLVKEHFGDVKGADKTTEEFHEKVKGDVLSEKIRKHKVWG